MGNAVEHDQATDFEVAHPVHKRAVIARLHIRILTVAGRDDQLRDLLAQGH